MNTETQFPHTDINFAFFDAADSAEDYAQCMQSVGYSTNTAFNYIQNQWEVAYWR